MQGKNFVILPYTVLKNGAYLFNDGYIKALYAKIVDQGLDKWTFYDGSMKSADQFLDCAKKRLFLLWVVCRKDDIHDPLAMITVNQFRGKTAHGHFCFFRETWGKDSIEIGKAAVDMLLSTESLDLLYGLVPKDNAMAVSFTEKIGGARMIPDLPKAAFNGENSAPAVLFYFCEDEGKST